MIKFLLSDYGIDIEADDKHQEDSWTNLHWACRYGHHQIVQLLLNRGADINAQTSKQSMSPAVHSCTLLRLALNRVHGTAPGVLEGPHTSDAHPAPQLRGHGD